MNSEKIGFIVLLSTIVFFTFLSLFISSYFYILVVPLTLLFIYACIETYLPSLHKTLFQKKPKIILNENGLNLVYFEKISDGVRIRFNKKNNKIDGEYATYFLGGRTKAIKANFIEGKISGKCTLFSITAGINNIEEIYEDGFLLNKKVFMIGFSNRGKLNKEEKYDKSEMITSGYIIDSIKEDSDKFNFTI